MDDHAAALVRAASVLPAAQNGGPLHVPADRLLQDWKAAHERARAYAAALRLPVPDWPRLADAAVARAVERPWLAGGDAITETLRALRELVAEGADGDRYLAWRLSRLLPKGAGATAAIDDAVLTPTPAIRRGRMVHEPVERRLWPRLFRRRPPLSERRRLRRRAPWVRAAHRRRLLLFLLVLVPTTIASEFMTTVLPHGGRTLLEAAIVVFFGALFGWISIGFWTAMFGFVVLMRGRDRYAVTDLRAGDIEPPGALPPDESPDPEPKTAIVMPVHAEPVDRIFAGLRAIYRSLERAGVLDRFHFYVLSDTADPSLAVAEELAWFQWCRDTGAFDRIFYRRRKTRIARKSGNVADFCRRFGRRYRYMVMLDADSLMSAETIVKLVETIERHPTVGLIQTVPVAVNRRSLLARITQFAGRAYGPMFAAGLHWWQLGDGQYWGHNTILRVRAFMDHCGLPRLPGREPLGGEILSHDFVEAALMARGGWGIWLAYDLEGSYEEVPSTLLEEMRRDRRWCQGNLQHTRLLFAEGFFGAHRMLFLNGALAYVSALLWFLFLALSTVEAIMNVLREPNYFPNGPSLFPEWPVWRPDWALALMSVIGIVLFLPKILAVIVIVARRRTARGYGGGFRLLLSVVLEIVASSLLAPIRMVFHSRFVLQNLLGRTVGWKSQGRGDEETSWREAFRAHGLDSLFASAWGATLYWLNPGYFWWITPIIGALLLAVPISVLTSRVRLGMGASRLGLFRIPEEWTPPAELRDLAELQRAAAYVADVVPEAERDGFVRAIVDPYVNALRRILAGRPRRLRPDVRAARLVLVVRGLLDGPAALTQRERRILLQDPELLDELHQRVWGLADQQAALRWGRPGHVPDTTSAA